MKRGIRRKRRIPGRRKPIAVVVPTAVPARVRSPWRFLWALPVPLLALVAPAGCMEAVLISGITAAFLVALAFMDRRGISFSLLVLGSSFMASYWFARPPFAFLFGDPEPLKWMPGSWAAVAGFVLAVVGFALVARDLHREDLSGGQARWGLGFILLVGAVFRLWRWNETHLSWGYDPYWEIMEVCNVVELGFHEIIFDLGAREPFFTYVLAVLWKWAPWMSPAAVSNVGSAAIDLTTVWVMYLVGKELAGRRGGLIAAALAASSKPMVLMTIACTRGVSVTLAAGLLLLFSLRLLRKPDTRHFLYWGVFLGAAFYTYTGIRLVVLWTALSVPWLLAWNRRKEPGEVPGAAGGTLLGAGSAALVFAFLRIHAFVSNEAPSTLFQFRTAPAVLFAVPAFAAWVFLFRKEGSGRATFLRDWFSGILLAVLVVLPLALHPLFSRYMATASIFWRRSFAEGLAVIPERMGTTFTHLFIGGWWLDRYDMNIPWDTFFGFFMIAAVVLGAAALLARFSARGAWLFLTACVGFSIYTFTDDPHTVRLLGGWPAAAGLGVLALDRAWVLFRDLAPSRIAGRAVLILLAASWLIGIHALVGRIWVVFQKQVDSTGAIVLQAKRESPETRVYLTPSPDFFFPHQINIQADGRDIRLLGEENTVFLEEGEPQPPVVVYVYKSGHHTPEQTGQVRLARRMPEVSWDDLRVIGSKEMYRLVVPPERVRNGRGPFRVRRIPEGAWKRDFLSWTFGLARGHFISVQDVVPAPDAPLPAGRESRSCRITGPLHLPEGGKVRFETESSDGILLSVDEREVFRARPRREGEGPADLKGSLNLEAGVHRVEMRLHLQGDSIPKVMVFLPGRGETAVDLGR